MPFSVTGPALPWMPVPEWLVTVMLRLASIVNGYLWPGEVTAELCPPAGKLPQILAPAKVLLILRCLRCEIKCQHPRPWYTLYCYGRGLPLNSLQTALVQQNSHQLQWNPGSVMPLPLQNPNALCRPLQLSPISLCLGNF
eukprot:527484-Rhodomonas_salina.2